MIDYGLVVIKAEYFYGVVPEYAGIVVASNREAGDGTTSEATHECPVICGKVPLDEHGLAAC